MLNPYFLLAPSLTECQSNVQYQVSVPQLVLCNDEEILYPNIFTVMNSHQQILK